MKITSENYFATVAKIGVENLSPALKKGHELIEKATKSGTDWKSYGTFKKQFDLTFEVLAKVIAASEKSKQGLPVKTDKPTVIHNEKPKSERAAVKPYSVETKTTTQKKSKDKPTVKGKDVELISPETAFIRRFASLNNKTKTKEQVLSFIRSLQKAIVERRIRITSKHGKLIEYIQQFLVDKYNKATKKNIEFSFPENDLIKYKKIGGGEVVLNSIRFIKAYIGLQGKEMTKEKAKSLYNRIVNAIEAKKLTTTDKYYKHIKVILNSLERFVKQKGTSPSLPITQAELNGLEGVLKECGCKDGLNGIADEVDIKVRSEKKPPQNAILNSQDVIDLKTHKLNFTGKWLSFIGNPSRGFTAMIYGKPKFGKSYLAIDFAGYLARNHGKVLYVAYEEGFDDTLKQKLQEKNVAHPNLFVADYLPANLKGYENIFIDSVNKAGLTPEELDKLERKNPDINFIYVYQTTKDGNHKGAMEHKHNVDIVIEVPQRGLATQYGRYNQGGEMKIFGN
ncbi:MAG: AAA family ATPase [Bacteroidota bacterium]|nr:AAA family ATPase [Bacteroidota bacterium]